MSATTRKKPATKNHTRQSADQPEVAHRQQALEPRIVRDLPDCPEGIQRWETRHVVAAKMRAEGKTWGEVASRLGFKADTCMRYQSHFPGWDVLYSHFRAIYIAELEDSLFEPALKTLQKIVTASENEFAQLQAVGLILGERNRSYGRLDRALKTPKGDEVQSTTTVIDNTIQAPDDKPGN